MEKDTVIEVIQKLLDERDRLLLERLHVRRKIQELVETDQMLERSLADRRAAGRVFGQTIAVPSDPAAFDSLEALEEEMARLRSGKKWTPHKSKPTKDFVQWLDATNGPRQLEFRDAESGEIAPPDRAPTRIRDRILEYLERAGPKGSKAAPIREYLEQVHGQKTHEKTVGMTLYRLLKEGLVGRNGHVWHFLQPKPEGVPDDEASGIEGIDLE